MRERGGKKEKDKNKERRRNRKRKEKKKGIQRELMSSTGTK